MNKYLTIKQVAEMLNVSTKTIERAIADGRLKSYKISHKCRRISEADLMEFVERGG